MSGCYLLPRFSLSSSHAVPCSSPSPVMALVGTICQGWSLMSSSPSACSKPKGQGARQAAGEACHECGSNAPSVIGSQGIADCGRRSQRGVIQFPATAWAYKHQQCLHAPPHYMSSTKVPGSCACPAEVGGRAHDESSGCLHEQNADVFRQCRRMGEGPLHPPPEQRPTCAISTGCIAVGRSILLAMNRMGTCRGGQVKGVHRGAGSLH